MEGDVEMPDKDAKITPPVTEDDLRRSFERVTGEAEESAPALQRPGVVIGSVLIAGVILVAFALGRRVGRKRSTVVEIVRV
jgi:hypothetical protein|tara:strand:+ start:743 stop:985 length:243 start_codon:yes stop_codon:yes gene_type:complete